MEEIDKDDSGDETLCETLCETCSRTDQCGTTGIIVCEDYEEDRKRKNVRNKENVNEQDRWKYKEIENVARRA